MILMNGFFGKQQYAAITKLSKFLRIEPKVIVSRAMKSNVFILKFVIDCFDNGQFSEKKFV